MIYTLFASSTIFKFGTFWIKATKWTSQGDYYMLKSQFPQGATLLRIRKLADLYQKGSKHKSLEDPEKPL